MSANMVGTVLDIARTKKTARKSDSSILLHQKSPQVKPSDLWEITKQAEKSLQNCYYDCSDGGKNLEDSDDLDFLFILVASLGVASIQDDISCP